MRAEGWATPDFSGGKEEISGEGLTTSATRGIMVTQYTDDISHQALRIMPCQPRKLGGDLVPQRTAKNTPRKWGVFHFSENQG